MPNKFIKVKKLPDGSYEGIQEVNSPISKEELLRQKSVHEAMLVIINQELAAIDEIENGG